MQRVFALSIDERVCWASGIAAQGVPGFAGEESGELVLPFPDAADGKIDLQQEIAKGLRTLERQKPYLFADSKAVGVGSMGIVDRRCRALVSIVRKPWRQVEGRGRLDYKSGAIIDFDELFKPLFPHLDDDPEFWLTVHNDASAKAHAEFDDRKLSNQKTLLYLMFDEGVNGGVRLRGRGLDTPLHTEMGHIHPQLHPLDWDFEAREAENGGCKAHRTCFEAVASLHRVRKSWGNPLSGDDFSLQNIPENIDAWNIIAWYIAQLCWTGALTFSVDIVVLGGRLINDGLVNLVRRHFDELNNRYITYPAMTNLTDFIVRSTLPIREAGLRGALALGRETAFRGVVRMDERQRRPERRN